MAELIINKLKFVTSSDNVGVYQAEHDGEFVRYEPDVVIPKKDLVLIATFLMEIAEYESNL